MRKQELQQKFNDMSVNLKGLVKDEHLLLLAPLSLPDSDYQHLRKMWKELEEDYNALVKARALVSEELWERYKLMSITGLPEQKIYEQARKKFTNKLKETLSGSKQKTPETTVV